MAGLFDYYFDPSTFGGSNGILGNLPMWAAQAGPSNGFPGDPAAIPQNAMPAIGGPIPQAQSPIFAPPMTVPQMPGQQQGSGETIGMPPQQPLPFQGGFPGPQAPQMQQPMPQAPGPQPMAPRPMAPPPQAPPGPDLMDRLGAGFGGLANTRGGGLLPAISNLVSGLATGQRTDPAGMQQQQLQATYQALRGSGVPDAMARAAALNPEILKTIAPAYFDTKPTLQKTGTDPFTGEDKFVWAQPNQMKLTPASTNPVEAAGGTTNPSLTGFAAAVKGGVSGQDLYQYLPDTFRNTVKAMIEGRAPLPSTVAMRSPQIMAAINVANTIDPNFDATTWAHRTATAKDFASGQASKNVTSLNTVIGHLGDLTDAADKLKNTSYPLYNSVGNMLTTQTGEAQINNFKLARNAVADEMAKVFRSSGMSDHEIGQWKETLNENMSPAQLKGAIKTGIGLMESRLSALNDQRSRGMAMNSDMPPLLNAKSQKMLEKITTWANSSDTPSAAPQVADGATATNPKTGQKIMFRGGQWVPVQ